MISVIKKPKYSVVCKSCGNTLEFEAEDVIFKVTVYHNVPIGEKPLNIKRYFIACTECEGHPNVERVASKTMKTQAEKRAKNQE